MANRTPKISGAGLGNLIEETPACTPVPQASSTVAHWNYDSVPAVISEDLKTAYQAVHLKDAIDGLESFSSKLKNAKSQFSEQNKNFLPKSNEFVPANAQCADVGSVMRISDAESSLGILKEDDMPGLSEDELENKWEHLLPSKSYVNKETTDIEQLSDLAVDMRRRLQRELAQRAINRVSFLSCNSVSGSLNEARDTNVGNEFLPNVSLPADVSQSAPKSLKVATVLNHSKNPSNLHNGGGHTEEIVKDQICDKMDKLDESLVLSQASGLEAFWNPFDHLKLEGESVGKMAAVMRDFSAEDFVPGDKCGERLAADESAWKKENVPPAAGPTFECVSTLDFSGIVGNSEISFHSTDISHCGHPKKRVSVGEFFRLRSEKLDELGTKTNIGVYFGTQAESPKKRHKLLPLVESDEDVSQEVPVSNQDCKKQTERTHKSPPSSDTRKTSLPSSEHSVSQRDSLSLSRIADILANVDTAASPRTVVSNILKESGLCNPKRIPPIKKTVSPKLPHISCTSNARSPVGGVLRDPSNVGSAAVQHRESVSSSSDSRCSTSCSLSGVSVIDSARKGVCNVQKEATCAVIDLLDDSDFKRRLSSSTVSDESSDGWVYTVPNTTLGVGAVLCSSSVKTGHNLPEENKNNDQIFTLKDRILTGDFNDLTIAGLVDNKQLDESVVCLTEKCKGSVDSYGVVPAMKGKNPAFQPELPEFGMKYIRSGVKPDWNSSINSVASNQRVSITPTECRLSLESVMSVSEFPENTWIRLKTPSPFPVVCVGVPHDIVLPVRNVTDRWILCGLELGEVKLIGKEEDKDYQCAVVLLPSKRVLMDPNNYKEAKIEVVPLCEGKLKISLKVQLNDVVTKAVQSETCDVFIIGEEPQIVVSKADNSNMNLDFGVLPEECAKEMSLKFCNPGSASIPLKLITVHQVQDKLSTFVLLDPEKQKNNNMAESEVSRELTFTLKPGGEMNVTVMFAAPPMELLTNRRGFAKLSGVLSMVLNGVVPIELESFNLIGSVGTTKLGIFRPAIPMQLVIMGPGKADSCRLPMRNHGVVHLTLALQLLPPDTDSISITVEPELVEISPGQQVEPIIRFTSSRPLKEPVQRMLQITMQPHGPVYFVEVTGIMIAPSTEEIKKPSKIQSEWPVATLKEPVMVCKIKSNKQHEMTPSHQSSKGNSFVKSPASNAQSNCSSEWLSIKSQKSGSSSSKSGEKVNVRTTHPQLVWGSVAVGKSVTKSFAVRSEDSCKLAVYVYVEDKLHSYELIDVDGPVMGQKCITLHPKKSHAFRVSFKPQVIGAAYGKVVFIIQGIHLIIPMYGFGGHARLIAKGVPRDGAGRMWLMLHQDPHKTEWETSFLLQNFGDLKAFVKIKPISKGFQNLNRTSLAVEPSELVMHEGTSAKIRVTYRPPQQDLKLLLNSSIKDVVEVAALSLVSGDEATRCRLRRIHERNQDMAKRRGFDHPSAHNQLDLQSLCAQFPGEDDQKTSDIMSLKDPPDSALDLYNAGVSHQEIILMLENATDADATQAFQTMYQYIVDLSTTRQEDFDESVDSDEWNIEPSAVTLHPPRLSSAAVALRSNGIHKHPFEAVVVQQPPGFVLAVSPNAGIIPAADVVELNVMCTQTDMPQTSQPRFWKGVVKVYIENDYKELNIRIQYPSTHNAGVLSKKAAPTDSSKCNMPMPSAGQNHVCGTPSAMYTVTKLREKKLTGSQLSHTVHAGTGRNNLNSPKCRRKVFVLQTD